MLGWKISIYAQSFLVYRTRTAANINLHLSFPFTIKNDKFYAVLRKKYFNHKIYFREKTFSRRHLSHPMSILIMITNNHQFSVFTLLFSYTMFCAHVLSFVQFISSDERIHSVGRLRFPSPPYSLESKFPSVPNMWEIYHIQAVPEIFSTFIPKHPKAHISRALFPLCDVCGAEKIPSSLIWRDRTRHLFFSLRHNIIELFPSVKLSNF